MTVYILLFRVAGIDPGSQEAYELAVKGFIRARDKSLPVIYGVKCVQFNSPHFVLGECTSNNEQFFSLHIHDNFMGNGDNWYICTFSRWFK